MLIVQFIHLMYAAAAAAFDAESIMNFFSVKVKYGKKMKSIELELFQ